MATFKVGQRVRKVAQSGNPMATNEVPIGAVGTIVEQLSGDFRGYEWIVTYDGRISVFGPFYAFSSMLAPLTDPKADAFIERIKKLQPLKEPIHG